MEKLDGPPRHAVIFASRRTDIDSDYSEVAGRMVELAHDQPRFPGIDSIHERTKGVAVSYWASEESVVQWKNNL